MSKVIAIGKRGGKIVGYKGGKPIYLQEEDQAQAAVKEPEGESVAPSEPKPVFPEGGKGAMGVLSYKDVTDLLADGQLEKDAYSKSGAYYPQMQTNDKGKGVIEIRRFDDNLDAVRSQMTASIMELVMDSPLTLPETHLMQTSANSLGRAIMSYMDEDLPIGLTSQLTPKDGDWNVQLTTNLNNIRFNLKGKEDVTAGILEGLIRQRLILRACGALNENARIVYGAKGTVIAEQNGRAFEVIPEAFDATKMAIETTEGNQDPVIAAVFNCIQKGGKELAEAFLKRAMDEYTRNEVTAQFGTVEKIKAVKGLVASLATPVGRVMGAEKFASGVNSMLGEMASLNANALELAKTCVKGVIKLNHTGPSAENFENFGEIEQIPVAPTDKPVPQKVTTAEKDVEEIPASAPEPEVSLEDALAEDGALQDAQVLRGSTQGGVVGTLGGKKIIIKSNKSSDNQSSEIAGARIIRSLLGNDACAEVVRVGKKAASEKLKGTGLEGSHHVAIEYVENNGTIPKKGVQIEANLTGDQKAELVGLAMASWCISDSDAHGGNFMIGKDGSLFRVDTGQAGVYSHMDGDPSNYQYSPNSNPIAFNDLLLYYAGQYTDEATSCTIDFNHPKIIAALEKIETEGPKLKGGGVIGLARGRSKSVRAHFEGLITAAMKMRSGDSSYSFSFGDGSAPPAWSPKTPDGSDKQPNKAHHYKKAFGAYEVLKNMGTGVNKAQEIRSKADGAKYIMKRFSGSKKISALAETIASNIAYRIMPPTVSANGQSYFPTVPAFLVNEGSSSSATVIQQKAFNNGNVQSVEQLTEKQKGQVIRGGLLRFLLGDHDGHSQQYMFTSPSSSTGAAGEADIISIDFGNAFKHDARSGYNEDIQSGYFGFNPQSPPPKLDNQLYQRMISGKDGFSVELFGTAHEDVKRLIENVEANKGDYVAMIDDYLELVPASKRDKIKSRFTSRLDQVRSQWETWANYVIKEAGGGYQYSVEDGLTSQVKKSIVLKGMARDDESLYKAIRTIPEELLMDEEGTHTDFALEQIKRFAEVCYNLFGDKVITRKDLRSSRALTTMRLQLPSLDNEFTDILNDPESRRLSR